MGLVDSFNTIVNNRRSVRIYDQQANFDSEAVVRSLEKAHLSPNSSNLQLWEFYHIQSEQAKKIIGEYCMGQPAATTANELVIFVTRRDKWKERAQWNFEIIRQSLSKEDLLQLESPKENKSKNALKEIGNSNNSLQRVQAVQNYYTKLIPSLYQSDLLGLSQYAKKLYVNFKGQKEPTYREVSDSDIRVSVHKSCALAAQTFMLAMTAEGYATCPMEGFDSKRIKEYLQLPNSAEINMVISCGVPKSEGIYGKRHRVDFDKVYQKV